MGVQMAHCKQGAACLPPIHSSRLRQGGMAWQSSWTHLCAEALGALLLVALAAGHGQGAERQACSGQRLHHAVHLQPQRAPRVGAARLRAAWHLEQRRGIHGAAKRNAQQICHGGDGGSQTAPPPQPTCCTSSVVGASTTRRGLRGTVAGPPLSSSSLRSAWEQKATEQRGAMFSCPGDYRTGCRE